MHEIFISYRRVDTKPWAIHLYEDLRRAFGDASVFMDASRESGIRWGADFETELASALARCQVLVALIGPQWARCTRKDGTRRLDVPDDWVRSEIATALRREVPVLPVLFEGAPAPAEGDLPDELRALNFHRRQAWPIAENNWRDDVARLVARAAQLPDLGELHTQATSPTGLRGLQELIRRNAGVARAVTLTQHVFSGTDLDVRKLKLLKDIHDALHTIEKRALDPLHVAGKAMLGLAAGAFREGRSDIEDLLRGAEEHMRLSRLLTASLPLYLAEAGAALERAEHGGDERDLHLAVSELQRLASTVPVELETMIEGVTAGIKLDDEAASLHKIHAALPPRVATDAEIRPLVQCIGRLDHLRDELGWRVAEHGVLQSLDVTLRRFREGQRVLPASGRSALADVELTWSEVRRAREDLRPPHSDELGRKLGVLQKTEAGIEAAIARGDAAEAGQRLGEYFLEVGETFYQVDKQVKKFFSDLAETTQPIKTILDMCSAVDDHG